MSDVYPLKDNQRSAVDPERTVWLSASAGTGKTQVLSARVLRLLLQPGVRPEQLLCLTFTKAGAAEMATRVNEVLARWVSLPDAVLAKELNYIGADVDPATIARARSRFTAVLDCPGGGLRIETIHAFSQWLLSAFPVEAGLSPGTRAMEDRDRELLLRKVLSDLLIEAEERNDQTLLDALTTLSLRLPADKIMRFLLRCASAGELWDGPGGWQPPLRPRINQLLGLPADDTGDTDALAELCDDSVFDCESLRRCLAAQLGWNTKSGREMSAAVGNWLSASPTERVQTLDTMRLELLTAKDTPKRLANLIKIDPDYEEYCQRVIASIAAITERKKLIALVDLLEPALALGRRFAIAWEEAKAREGFVDFDDLIRRTAALLSDQGIGQWVRYKLDRSIDHVLVDEAQDTNAAQWDIIDALVSDFFSGEGQRADHLRTLFVVGDYKQAIFRFQGTSPENFEAARLRVKQQLQALSEVLVDESRELADLGLGQSYRTALPVLQFVDEAIKHIGPENFGLVRAPERHVGKDRPGLVTLWAPVSLNSEDAPEEGPEAGPGAGPEAEDDDTEQGDEGQETWLSRPDRLLADRLAKQVRAWMDEGFPLHKPEPARKAGPGDIMILVRKRKDLAGLIVARLHAHGVPVAGVDRLRLGAPLAVKDLLAALRFAAQPLDDLNLASLLVSPLLGWTQEDLLKFAYRGKHVRLWDHLRASEGPDTTPTMERLRSLLALADYQPPQALLHWLLLGPWQGRQKLVARLGQEANDPIDELLNAAMAYTAKGTPSLVGFLQWFDAGEGELKREAGKASDLVRVMTVHGSKGLQAPIVILADAADDPKLSNTSAEWLEEERLGTVRKVPLPPLRKSDKAQPILDAEQVVRQQESAEHCRLLYVAMTRAEEALFIAGTYPKGKTEVPPSSWYGQLSQLFADKPETADRIWGTRREWGHIPPLPNVPVPQSQSVEQAELPGWLTQPVGPEPRPPRPLAPSSLGEDEAPDPPFALGPGASFAARRGTLIHRLIERLPELPAEARHAAATQWLEQTAGDIPAAERNDLRDAALGVVNMPAWADVFGPASLAEVPLAAVVEGRVISGTIDRMVISNNTIRIIDFKTSRRPAKTAQEVQPAYIRQMAAYCAALETIYPGHTVEAALLYTQEPILIVLPQDLINAEKAGISSLTGKV